MSINYIVPPTENPTNQELKFLTRFTALHRAGNKCEQCGAAPGSQLDIAHIQSVKAHPELRFDPANVMVLCRSCHMKHDHENGHRPSGRPMGYTMPDEFRQKMRQRGQERFATPESRMAQSVRAKAQWDKQGRKPDANCLQCNISLTRKHISRGGKFCSPACHYQWQTGKPRSRQI